MKKSVELLNKAVTNELSCVHQYLSFYFYCDHQGYYPPAILFKKIANEKIKHIEKLAKRILLLNGEVDLAPFEKVQTIKNLKDMFGFSKEMEKEGMEKYGEYANVCSAIKDPVSKQLFDSLANDEERHYDQFANAITNFGEVENYSCRSID